MKKKIIINEYEKERILKKKREKKLCLKSIWKKSVTYSEQKSIKSSHLQNHFVILTLANEWMTERDGIVTDTQSTSIQILTNTDWKQHINTHAHTYWLILGDSLCFNLAPCVTRLQQNWHVLLNFQIRSHTNWTLIVYLWL